MCRAMDMVGRRMNSEFWWRIMLKIHLEDLKGDGRITLRWILGKQDAWIGGARDWFRIVSKFGFLY
jgi:hypothetical protein